MSSAFPPLLLGPRTYHSATLNTAFCHLNRFLAVLSSYLFADGCSKEVIEHSKLFTQACNQPVSERRYNPRSTY